MTLEEFDELYVDKAINCRTEELSNEFLELAHSLGFTWYGNKLTSFNGWDVYKDKTCYIPLRSKEIIYHDIDNLNMSIIEFKGEIK